MKLNLVHVAGICLAWLGSLQLVSATAAIEMRGKESTGFAWQTVNVIQTNAVQRFVTNVIEVRAPQNVFIDEYRTNWVLRTLTNIVNVPATNWVTKALTNFVPVTLIRTNFVTGYQTNWSVKTLTNTVAINLVQTNVVDQRHTNWTTLTLTNRVEQHRTNWLTLTLTNRTLIDVTNWETVVVTKTNWIPQALTNFVEIDVPFTTTVLRPVDVTRAEPKTEAPPLKAEPDVLVIETVKTSRVFENNEIEVKFKMQLSGGAALPLSAPQWRVERNDGAVLFSAQTQEFSRRLPAGRYSIEAKARRDAGSPLLVAQSVLEVKRDSVASR